jgi:hypothetical protein
MRRWLSAVRSAGDAVAERPALWLPGALAWVATIGWLALVFGVATPPTVAELTFLGARIVGSGMWPWNLVAFAAAAAIVVVLAFVLVAAGEAALLRGRRASPADVARIAAIGLVCALPAMVAVAATVAGFAAIARGEFNAPVPGPGPLVRTALRLAPLLIIVVVAAAAGAALQAAAVRRAVAGRGVARALREAPGALAASGPAALLQAAALLLARIAYLAVATIMVRVLWAPIAVRLESEGIGLAGMLLLVGFVAIWLCLVLGGGALHAWGSASWTRVVGVPVGRRSGAEGQMETHSHP